MKTPITFLAIMAMTTLSHSQNIKSNTHDFLSDNFKNTPVDAKPKALWDWVNGNFSLSQITRELEDIKAKGMGGFDIWDVGTFVYGTDQRLTGPEFLSDRSVQAIAHAIREADLLGLEIGLITSSSWNSGGTWISSEHTAMGLYTTQIEAQKGQKALTLPFPEIVQEKKAGRSLIQLERDPDTGRPQFYKDVATLALRYESDSILDRSNIINLSSKLVGDQLSWTVPEGSWKIVRFVCAPTGQPLAVPSPNSAALQMDHFSASAQKENLEYIFDRLEGELGDLRNHPSLKYLYVDSYEVNSGIWSPNLSEFFKDLHGYDMTPYLPALNGFTIENKETTQRFVEDYKKALSEMIIKNHYTLGEQICQEHGIAYAAEAGGPGPPIHNVPFEDLKALGSLSYLRGEFWNKHKSLEELQIIKGIASAAHIYGKRYIEAEAFTSVYVWQEGPAELKPLADRAMCEGLNRFVYHTFPHTPPESGTPGWIYNFGTIINTTRAWWPLSTGFHTYLGRCSYLLQEGNFIADVAYYYGSKAPNFASPAIKIPGLSHKGYDYDVINTEVLVRDMEVDNGQLVLPNGQRYNLLVLSNETKMDVEALKKIKQLVESGATIIGEKPTTVHGLSNLEKRQADLDRLSDELWGKTDSEKGKIISTQTPDQVLQNMGLGHDFKYGNNDKDSLQFIHRKYNKMDYYFFRNVNPSASALTISFRQTGKIPELWNAETGKIIKYPVYKDDGTYITMPFNLEGYESVFVVFKDGNEDHIESISTKSYEVFSRPEMLLSPGQMTENVFLKDEGKFKIKHSSGTTISKELTKSDLMIEGDWILKFPHGWGAPQVDTINNLKSWHEFDNGTKYFSGTGVYQVAFDFDINDMNLIQLDLGEVYEISKIYLNGNDLGEKWHAPYSYNITPYVKSGTNYLTVEVANLMNNQMIGDSFVPDQYKRTHSNIDKGPTPWAKPWSEVPLKPSGLIGPVSVTGLSLE